MEADWMAGRMSLFFVFFSSLFSLSTHKSLLSAEIIVHSHRYIENVSCK